MLTKEMLGDSELLKDTVLDLQNRLQELEMRVDNKVTESNKYNKKLRVKD